MTKSGWTAFALALVVTVGLAGCGEDDDEGSDFPPPEGSSSTVEGYAVLKVSDHSEGEELCQTAQADPPDAYADYGGIVFDIPGDSEGGDPEDIICVLP